MKHCQHGAASDRLIHCLLSTAQSLSCSRKRYWGRKVKRNLLSRSWQRWLRHQTATLFPYTCRGKKQRIWSSELICPGLRKHQRRMAGRWNDYTETEWDANNPLKILLGLKVRSGCWGKVKLPKPSNLILSNNIKEQCLNTKEIVHAAAKEFMYLEE